MMPVGDSDPSLTLRNDAIDVNQTTYDERPAAGLARRRITVFWVQFLPPSAVWPAGTKSKH